MAGQKPRILHSEATDIWYVVTRYNDLGEGKFRAITKYPISPSVINDIVAHNKSARIRELEAELSKARDCAAHYLDRCGEQRKENAALREALGVADKKIELGKALLKKAMLSGDIPTTPNTYTLVNTDMYLNEARALIEAALKGV